MTTIDYRFVLRSGTAAAAATNNQILLKSEIGYETDTGKMKIGDGVTAWNSLPYFAASDQTLTWMGL